MTKSATGSDNTLLESGVSAVCLLIINMIEELPQLAIRSILANTNARIFIGYCRIEDLVDVPRDDRITPVLLEHSEQTNLNISVNSVYADFDSEGFYRLVTLKWSLLRKIFGMGYTHVVYSDLDVIWLKDVAGILSKTHSSNNQIECLIQSFTSDPAEPRLCMGLLSVMNTSKVIDFLNDCESLHIRETNRGNYIGDDDIVTYLFRDRGYPNWIRELPQGEFPVGNFLNLYTRKTLFPGLAHPTPAIFHANFVVGLRNKRLLLRVFMSPAQRKILGADLGMYWRILLLAKRVRIKVGTLRKSLISRKSIT